MAVFDYKNFMAESFGQWVDLLKDFKVKALITSDAIVDKTAEYKNLFAGKGGQTYLTDFIKAPLDGEAEDYDGETDVTFNSRKTYAWSRPVIGKTYGVEEKDFSKDITGEDFLPAAGEIATHMQGVNEKALYSILKGVFAMDDEDFIGTHTYSDAVFDETTINNAAQQALGDYDGEIGIVIAHSKVITNLKNKGLVEYAKYTDPNGIMADITLATLNGRILLKDDSVPVDEVEPGYVLTSADNPKALKVVDSGAGAGEINKTDVSEDIEGVEAGDYVVYSNSRKEYTAYGLGKGAIEYANIGADVPAEMYRDPAKNGGVTRLVYRERVVFAPVGVSFKKKVNNPTKADLEDGKNWEVAGSEEGGASYPLKGINIIQIKTRG